MPHRSGLRAHPILAALGLLMLVALAVAIGAVWFVRGDEARLGRSLSWMASRYLGRPVRIDRVKTDGHTYIELRGVRVPPVERGGGAMEIRLLRVEGGVLPVVFPRGRAMSVVAVSTSFTLAQETSPLAPPAPDTLTAIRTGMLRFLEWPAAVSLEIKGGELRSGSATLSFDLKGEKSGDGKLALRVNLRGNAEPEALIVEAFGAAVGHDLRLTVRARGDPRRLAAFLPSALPPLGPLSAAVDLVLSTTPELDVTGTLSASPLSAALAARYRPRAQRLDLSRLALEWSPGLRLDLSGSAEELDTAPRVVMKVTGSVDGSGLTGGAAYSGASGAVAARLDLRPFAAGPLLERFGYPRPPLEVSARSAAFTLDGKMEGNDRGRVEGTLKLEELKFPWALTGVPTRALLRFAGAVSRRGGRISPGELHSGDAVLTSPTADIVRVTAETQARGNTPGLWPMALDARIPDLSRLPVPKTLAVTLSGDARASGILDWTDSGPRFAGRLAAHVPMGVVNVGGQMVISDLRASLPIQWGGSQEVPAGTVSAESLTAFGFVLRRIASPARIKGTTLSLPGISYLHYGGSGKGYAQAELAGAPVPLSMRVEGEGVDLTTFTTEYGLTVGRITGKVRYLLVAQYLATQGLVAGGQVASDPPGGEINIDALKKLLSFAEQDPTGILRRTLESLSVFSYESFTGDIRVGPHGGRVSLSLEGKKRLGLFPGRVQAINFQNVPLSLLVKTFGQPRRDSP